MPEELRDHDGYVYQKNWAGRWVEKPELITGHARDTSGLREQAPATDWLGRQQTSYDGKPLYRSPDVSSTPTSGGGDAAAALLSVLLLIAVVFIAGALLALLGRVLAALINAYRDLVRRYPRAMLTVHLLAGMVAVGYGLAVAGFGPAIQIGGAALVPGIWGWLWLTRHLPLVFLPINALLAGGVLWLVAEVTRTLWLPTWSRLTTSLPPALNNLSIVLAALPIILLVWTVGVRRWPRVFAPLNLLAVGAILWFLLLRVWTNWLPLWTEWTAPVRLLPPVGWLIFLAPLILWLWQQGQARWPTPFLGLNLLVLGGLLGLTAYNTQPAWIATWRHWMAGLPFVTAPILVISLSPVTLWGWSRVSHRWPRAFVIPNLLITGVILWLVLERTRPLWMDAWRALWGEVPLALDPVPLIFVLPLIVWAWKQGSQRWPRVWGALRALLWGAILWWIAERTRVIWQAGWRDFAGQGAPDLALLAGLTPLLLWSWVQLRKRWRRVATAIALIAVTAGLFWIMGRLLPDSTLVLRVAVALLPAVTWGWSHLLRRRPRLGWSLALLPWVGLGLLAWLAPNQFRALALTFLNWLAAQGVRIPVK